MRIPVIWFIYTICCHAHKHVQYNQSILICPMLHFLNQGCPSSNHWGATLNLTYLPAGCIIKKCIIQIQIFALHWENLWRKSAQIIIGSIRIKKHIFNIIQAFAYKTWKDSMHLLLTKQRNPIRFSSKNVITKNCTHTHTHTHPHPHPHPIHLSLNMYLILVGQVPLQ
jgi:hypothetical protein